MLFPVQVQLNFNRCAFVRVFNCVRNQIVKSVQIELPVTGHLLSRVGESDGVMYFDNNLLLLNLKLEW